VPNNAYSKVTVSDQIEATTIRNLEKTTEFMIALNSEVGRVLFNDLVLLLDQKFELIYKDEADERDRAIFTACKYIGSRWNKLIEAHGKSVGKLQKLQDERNRKTIG